MGTYNIVAGIIVTLIIAWFLMVWGASLLFPNARQEREDEAYRDASLLDRDGSSF